MPCIQFEDSALKMSTKADDFQKRNKIVTPRNSTYHRHFDFLQALAKRSCDTYEISSLTISRLRKKEKRIKEKEDYHQKKRLERRQDKLFRMYSTFTKVFYQLDFTVVDF